MKLASLETLTCDAGWRPWLFVKATTDDGLVGWSEVTDSHGSPTGLAGVAFCLLRERTDNLAGPIIAHWLADGLMIATLWWMANGGR